jgi:hypothetical protein
MVPPLSIPDFSAPLRRSPLQVRQPTSDRLIIPTKNYRQYQSSNLSDRLYKYDNQQAIASIFTKKAIAFTNMTINKRSPKTFSQNL